MDIENYWKSGVENSFTLHEAHLNPQFPQVLKIIGFDNNYIKAEGTTLWDDKGNEYLDFLAGYSVFNLGHNYEPIKAALRSVLDTSWPNIVQMFIPALSAKLAEKLTAKDSTGRLEYVYFGNSGSESVEAALKFAKAATGRPRLLSVQDCFHGCTMGALSMAGDESWKEGFGPFLPGCSLVPFGDLYALEKELATKDVAAIIIEPIQGEAGVREHSVDQWKEIQRLCRKYGTLLILDEVQTGLGRTGKFYAFEHWGIEPDLVCISKALTNGMVPCSATLGTKAVFSKVYNRLDRCVVHGSTYGENNLAMAAGLAVIDEMDRNDILRKSSENGALFLQKLKNALSDFDLVKDVRGRGMMIAIEFGAPTKSLSLKMGWTLLHKANKALFGQMITTTLMSKHKILTQVAGHNLNVLKLSPPLTLTEAEMDRFVNAIEDVVTECHKFPGGIWDFGLGLAKRAINIKVL